LNTIDLEKLEKKQESLLTKTEISELMKIGRKQTYLTDDDILAVIPEAENDIDMLDQIFARMLAAGIRYISDESEIENEDKEQQSTPQHATGQDTDPLS